MSPDSSKSDRQPKDMTPEEMSRREQEAQELLGEDWENTAETPDDLKKQAKAAENEVDETSGIFKKDMDSSFKGAKEMSGSLGVSVEDAQGPKTEAEEQLEGLEGEASMVATEAQLEIKTEAETNAEQLDKKIQDILTDLGKISPDDRKSRESARTQLISLIEESRKNPDNLDRIFETVDTKLIEIAETEKSSKQQILDQAMEEHPEKYPSGTKYSALDTGSFHNITAIIGDMENSNPELASQYLEYTFNTLSNELSDKNPAEIRSRLRKKDDHATVRIGLSCVYKRMLSNEDIPSEVQESLAKLLPVLEKSDGADDIDESRFLKDDKWIERSLPYNARTANQEKVKADVIKIRTKLTEFTK